MRRITLLALASAALLSACSSTTTGGAAPATTGGSAPAGTSVPTADVAPPSGVLPGYDGAVDELSPLIITTLGPEPIPFTGSDGQVHVSYELQVFNFSPRAASFTQIETLDGGPDGEVLATMTQEEVVAITMLAADFPAALGPVTEIPPGRVALLVLDDVYATSGDVPASVTHRIDATFAALPPGQLPFADSFPTQVSQIGGEVRTSDQSAVVIGSPLAGDGWLVASGCCALSAHRFGMFPIGGRVNGTERYAIDWLRVDPTAPDPATGLLESFTGDPTDNESYLAYGDPVLAVADATVVAVTDDMANIPPGAPASGLQLDEFGGNRIVLDLGGVHAFYGHLVPGSITVKVGDRVTKGQVIGQLGNSGNTTEPHLHFQLMRSIGTLSGDNVPFEIERFSFVGSVADTGLVAGPDAGPRTNQYPLGDSITDFPPAP